MGPYVHRDLTRKWAVAAGFSPEDAAAIGQACLHFDTLRWTKPWGHFRLIGAGLIAKLTARLANRRRNLVQLGYALHMAQDAIGHGWIPTFMHKPELDDWSTADDSIKQKIRDVSTRMLTAYQLSKIPWSSRYWS